VANAAVRKRSSWRRDPDGKRLRILDAAARLAGEGNYAGVRTSDIARAAGVSEGTIFHQFGTKNGVFVAVAERYAEGFLNAMFEDFDADAEKPDVDSVFRRAFAYVRHNAPDFGAFLMATQEADGRSARTAYRERIVLRLTQDAEILAELSFGVVETALRECFTRGKRDRESAYVGEVVATIRSMLGLAS